MLNETDRRILMESSVELARHGHNEHALAIASLLARAQADAQPVAQWQWRWKGDEEWHNSTEENCKKAEKNTQGLFEVRSLYTHPAPEAALALSDEARAWIKEAMNYVGCKAYPSDLLSRGEFILTRRAATVAEPSSGPWYGACPHTTANVACQQCRDKHGEGYKRPEHIAQQLEPSDYEEVLADHRRLVRELDVLLNGEAGAAQQASLCDIVAQVRRKDIRSQAAQQQAEPSEPKHTAAKAGQHCVNCGLTLGQQTSWCNCEANRAVEAQQAEPVGDERIDPTGLIARLRIHAEDRANTAFSRSTMREAIGILEDGPHGKSFEGCPASDAWNCKYCRRVENCTLHSAPSKARAKAPVDADTSAFEAWPKVLGVGRDNKHSRNLVVYLGAAPTDGELRAIHDTLRAAQSGQRAGVAEEPAFWISASDLDWLYRYPDINAQIRALRLGGGKRVPVFLAAAPTPAAQGGDSHE